MYLKINAYEGNRQLLTHQLRKFPHIFRKSAQEIIQILYISEKVVGKVFKFEGTLAPPEIRTKFQTKEKIRTIFLILVLIMTFA